MTVEPTVISGPVKEAVGLGEAKLQCKVDYWEDDELFAIWIAAARDYVEAQAGITIHEKTLETTRDYFPGCNYIRLPRATPLIAVTSMIYTSAAGVATTWPSSNYIVDTDSKVGRIVLADGISWPSDDLLPANGIRIRYRAGLATASPEVECEAKYKYPIMLLINGFDRNRSAESMPDRATMSMIAINFGVNAWIDRLRVESHIF